MVNFDYGHIKMEYYEWMHKQTTVVIKSLSRLKTILGHVHYIVIQSL